MKLFSVSATLLLASFLATGGLAHAQDAPDLPAATKAWNFTVYLNDKSIGSHSFKQYAHDDGYEMRIAADFSVKFLFITAYSYQHRNRELWRDDCLQAIESQTDDNGELFSVKGRQLEDGFEVVTNQQTSLLPRCVTTFAYWNPGFLTQSALLNAQTGEYMPAEISGPFPDTRVDRGKSVTAQRYRIQAEGVDIKLWYSASGDWLALESALENDRTLRYERI